MTSTQRMIGAAMATLALLALTLPASASPIDDARARALAIARQRQHIITDAERVNERRLATTIELDQLHRDEAQLGVQLATTDQTLQNLSGQATELAIQAYVQGTESNGIAAVLNATDASDIPVRQGYGSALIGSNQDLVDHIRSARDDTLRSGRRLADLLVQKGLMQASLDADQVTLTKAETDLAALAKQTDATIFDLVAKEGERLAKEAADLAAAKTAQAQAAATVVTTAPALKAKAAQVATPTSAFTPVPARTGQALAAPTVARVVTPAASPKSPTATARPVPPSTAKPVAQPVAKVPSVPVPQARPTPTTSAPVADDPSPVESPPVTAAAPRPVYPAPSAGAAIAVAEALRQLGKSYVFGAAGPDVFDCSGLTQWAWAKAGVSMDHFTGSQFNAFPHIPLDQIQPGDLVFLRVDLGHMGMYIGGGEFIHAPRTGDVVRISSISSAHIAGVVRPG